MKNIKSILRVSLGLPMVVFGLNGFLQFIPMPEIGPEAGAFMGAIASTGTFFPLISLVEIAAGALLLLNKATPLALLLVFPILICAVLYHLALDPGGILFAGVCFVLNVILLFFYKHKYQKLLSND